MTECRRIVAPEPGMWNRVPRDDRARTDHRIADHVREPGGARRDLDVANDDVAPFVATWRAIGLTGLAHDAAARTGASTANVARTETEHADRSTVWQGS